MPLKLVFKLVLLNANAMLLCGKAAALQVLGCPVVSKTVITASTAIIGVIMLCKSRSGTDASEFNIQAAAADAVGDQTLEE